MRGWMLPVVALAGAALGGVGMWSLERARGGPVGAQVRDYLLAHPEVIPEAMTRLQDRETGKLIAGRRAAIETPYGSAWTGNPKGDVTVVEYLDYNCTFCRATLPAVAQLLARDRNVRVVYREFPILAESSRLAARASLAAAAQGRHAKFHDALYAGGPVTPATIAAAGRAAGIDPGRTPADADAEIARNVEVARALGFTGTPAWVVGNRVLSGLQPTEALEEAVRAARAARGGT